LRMRLASHSAANGWSELSLGRIIQQSGQGGAGHAQRGTWLGEGFYGHTDGWAVVRAGQGLLLSTTARAAQGASVASTQMDAAEAVGQLKSARQLGLALSESAAQQGAHPLRSLADGQAAQQHADAMDPVAKGRYDGAVQGQAAQKASGRALGEPVERLAQPVIHLDTPASASLVTPASLSIYSGQDTSIVAQGDAHFTAAQSFSGVSGQTGSLYTHTGGIKAITGSGPLSLRAHTDSQQLWADQDITIQSTTDEVRIQAKDSITLTAGQSQVVLKGGDVTFTCPGTWTVKAAGHAWMGGGASSASLMALPDGTDVVKDWIELDYRDPDMNQGVAGAPYEIHLEDGSTLTGVLDAQGRARHDNVLRKKVLKVVYPPRNADKDKVTAVHQHLLG
jgi:type VI secretion system secreted protein VgrG